MYLRSTCCIPGTVLGGREILTFVFPVVVAGIWTVLGILFHAHGAWGAGGGNVIFGLHSGASRR